MSEKLAEAEALINGANDSLVSKLNEQAPRGTPTVTVKGRFPLWNVKIRAEAEEEGTFYPVDWALRMRPSGSFSDGRISVNGTLYEPYISGSPVSSGVALSLNPSGGSIYYEILHDTEAFYNAPNHEITVTNVSVNLISVAELAPWTYPTLSYISASPVDTAPNAGAKYVFLLKYSAGGTIVTYGGNTIIDPEFTDVTAFPVTVASTTYQVVA